MSRTFSIQTVLRMVPNRLLKEFLGRLGHGDLGIEWEQLGERDIEPIHAPLRELTRNQFDTVEAALHNVFDLSCETGIDALLEAGQLCGDHCLPAALPQEGGPYHKAMWAWLNRTDAFEKAVLIHQVEHLAWWRKRDDLPRKEPNTSEEARRHLERELSDLLLSVQGRGKDCTVDLLSRGATDYFFAHPDDFVQNVTAHDEDGRLAPRTFRQTFMIVFAYDRREGTLELFAKVAAKIKPRLEELFARVVLGFELGPWRPDAVYELNHLKDRSFALATDPSDAVRVRIRRMRLALKNSHRRITLEADPDAGPDDIYDALANCLHPAHLPLSAVNVTLVTFGFEFEPVDGRKPGSMSFDVAYPNSCSLRNQRPERVELALKYLRRWKIDGTRSVIPDPPEDGG